MEVNVKVRLNVRKEGRNLIIGDLPTLQLVMGSTAVSGNLNYYKIDKKGTDYIVPKKVVEERVRVLILRRDKLNDSIELMSGFINKK